VTGPRGLLRYSIASVVPNGTPEVRCSIITPMLYSPDREGRAPLAAHRRERQSTGRRCTQDFLRLDGRRERAGSAHGHCLDNAVPASLRAQRLLGEPGVWGGPISFYGAKALLVESAAPAPFAAPLFDVHDPYIWVCITLTATAGGFAPALMTWRCCIRDSR